MTTTSTLTLIFATIEALLVILAIALMSKQDIVAALPLLLFALYLQAEHHREEFLR